MASPSLSPSRPNGSGYLPAESTEAAGSGLESTAAAQDATLAEVNLEAGQSEELETDNSAAGAAELTSDFSGNIPERGITPVSGVSVSEPAEPPSGELEIVISLSRFKALFFGTVTVLLLASGAAFFAGRNFPHTDTAAKAAVIPSVVPPEALAPKPEPKAEVPLAGTPDPSRSYVQVGTAGKDLGMLVVEGLRTHDLQAFAAAGPDAKSIRILVGPLASDEEVANVRAEAAKMGLNSFVWRPSRNAAPAAQAETQTTDQVVASN